MNWLSQNWIWAALFIGVFFFVTRMSGCGKGRSRGHGQSSAGNDRDAGNGVGSDTILDPVSRNVISAGSVKISSVYQDRAYFFETRDNRDMFEREPEKYISDLNARTGIPVEPENGPQHRRHRGC